MPFTKEITPRFNQLDPAGILFFGEVFTISSWVYEDFLVTLGYTWDEWFRNPDVHCPIRHTEADYFRPLEGGRIYEVTVELLNVGNSSFEIGFVFQREGNIHCRVRLVHVFIDGRTRLKTPVPDTVRERFNRYGVQLPAAAST